jgi:hypothetical protein
MLERRGLHPFAVPEPEPIPTIGRNLRERITQLGVVNADTYYSIVKECGLSPRPELFADHDSPNSAYADHALNEFVVRAEEIEAGRKASRYSRERQMLFLLTALCATLSDLRGHPEAAARIQATLEQAARPRYADYRPLNRLLGLRFQELSPFLDPDQAQKLQHRLIIQYPMGILPSLSLADIEEVQRNQFRLDDSIETPRYNLRAVPLLSVGDKNPNIEYYGCGTCSMAERHHTEVANDPAQRLELHYQGRLLGGIKKSGEDSLLVLQSVVADDRPLLLRGGLYQFIATDLPWDSYDDTPPAIDLAELPPNSVEFLPLRLWDPQVANDEINRGKYIATVDEIQAQYEAHR